MNHRNPVVVRLLPFAVAAGMMSALGCGGGGKFSSPEATFEAAKAAGKNKDWKGYCDCLTPDSVDAMAGVMIVAGSKTKQFARLAGLAGKEQAEKMKQAAEKIAEVLKQHGVTEGMIEKASKPTKPFDAASLAELAEPVKDKKQFLADMVNALQQLGGDEQDFTGNVAEATLKDVKFDGDEATAMVVAPGKEHPLNFKKVGGEWKIDFVKSMNAAPPAGGAGGIEPGGIEPGGAGGVEPGGIEPGGADGIEPGGAGGVEPGGVVPGAGGTEADSGGGSDAGGSEPTPGAAPPLPK